MNENTGIGLDQPVRVTPELAPGHRPHAFRQLPRRHGRDGHPRPGQAHGDGRGIIGLFAADALRDAIDRGVIGPAGQVPDVLAVVAWQGEAAPVAERPADLINLTEE